MKDKKEDNNPKSRSPFILELFHLDGAKLAVYPVSSLYAELS